jgi:hypothetical protein
MTILGQAAPSAEFGNSASTPKCALTMLRTIVADQKAAKVITCVDGRSPPTEGPNSPRNAAGNSRCLSS